MISKSKRCGGIWYGITRCSGGGIVHDTMHTHPHKAHTNLQRKHAKVHAQRLSPPSHMAASLSQASNHIRFGCCARWVKHRLAHITLKWRQQPPGKLMPYKYDLNRLCRSTTTQFAIDMSLQRARNSQPQVVWVCFYSAWDFMTGMSLTPSMMIN